MSAPPTKEKWKNLRVTRQAGSGGFGVAFLVTDDSGKSSVVKRSHGDYHGDVVEPKMMARLSCDYIVRIMDCWVEPGDPRLYIQMERCNKGDFATFLKRRYPLPEKQLLSFMVQLLMGLEYMHLKHMMHRDIKLENIFVHESRLDEEKVYVAKYGDFGISKRLPSTEARSITVIGTPRYFSPEVSTGRTYSRKSDVWCLGVAFYCMMTLNHPFDSGDGSFLEELILRHHPPHPSSNTVYSKEIGDVVMSMLIKSRSKRPLPRELLADDVFRDTLSIWPWKPTSFMGTSAVFVSRRDATVNIRAGPSLEAKVIGSLKYGDISHVRRRVICNDDTQQLWFRLINPMPGYCLVGYGAESLFKVFQDPGPCGESAYLHQLAPATRSTLDIKAVSSYFYI